jgi:soluble lytic murein transglycosylase-like protein
MNFTLMRTIELRRAFQKAVCSSRVMTAITLICAFLCENYYLTINRIDLPVLSFERYQADNLNQDNYYFSSAIFDFYEKPIGSLSFLPVATLENLILQSIDPLVRKRSSNYLRAMIRLSEKYQIDPFWVISVAWTESHFEPSALSYLGAKGIMQVMPETETYILNLMQKYNVNLEARKGRQNLAAFFPQVDFQTANQNEYKKILTNLEVGVFYLKFLSLRFQNSYKATVAYNMGPGWTQKNLQFDHKFKQENNNYLNKVSLHYEQLTGNFPLTISYVTQLR